MDFYDMDHMWHEIREKMADEEKGLSARERFVRNAKSAAEYSKKYDLKTAKATRRGTT